MFATAFDQPSVDFLEEIGLAAYKVASGDITNTPLFRYLAQTGKPIILSTGGASLAAVERPTRSPPREGGRGGAPVHGGLSAGLGPARPARGQTYREAFPRAVVGLSSHDNGIAMATAAYVLGARVVEKHFTLDRTMRGTDHSFSLEPHGLPKMVRDLGRLHVALGDGDKTRLRQRERSDHEDVEVGVRRVGPSRRSRPAREDLTLKCPGGGLAPSELDSLVGASLLVDVRAETRMCFELVDLALIEGSTAAPWSVQVR